MSEANSTPISENEQLKKLRCRENIYRNAILSNSTGCLEVNLSTGIIESDIYDYRSPEAAMPLNIPELGTPLRYDAFEQWWADNMLVSDKEDFLRQSNCAYLLDCYNRGKRVVNIYCRSRMENGGISDSRQSYSFSRDEESGDIWALCIVFDMTDSLRQRAGKELFMNIFDSVYLIDLEMDDFTVSFRKQWIDEKYSRIGGYTEKITEWIMTDVVEDDRFTMLHAIQPSYIRQKLENQSVFSLGFRERHSGVLQYHEMQVVRGANWDGRIVAMGFVNRDEQTRRELESLQMLQDAREKAERANRAKTEFMSRMSHDLRTPLNGIMGMTDIAKKHLDDKERIADCLGKITGSSNHLLSLVNDVLDMSRIESGAVVIAHESFNCKNMLDDCIAIIEGELENRDLEFTVTREPLITPYVLGDALRLKQILINILSNAVKFTPNGGRITLEARNEAEPDGIHALFSYRITDTGIGMSPEFAKQLFEPFSQEESGARTEYKGVGLGMAISKNLISLMGGSITAESEPDKGSSFLVQIPLEYDRSSMGVNIRQDTTELRMEDIRILLVEDNELNMEIAQMMLRDSGVQTEEARNGAEALEMFNNSSMGYYSMILMDVMMPIMDGCEAAAAIRALPRMDAKNVPIVAMTANAFAEDMQKSAQAGMNEHLSKPLDEEKLLWVIRKYCRGKRS